MTPSLIVIPATIAYYLFLLYFLIMWGRFILDLVRNFVRGWRPTGFVLLLSEFIYLMTDPPIKLVRRVLPTFRIGGLALDFSWSVVMIATLIMLSVSSALQVTGA